MNSLPIIKSLEYNFPNEVYVRTGLSLHEVIYYRGLNLPTHIKYHIHDIRKEKYNQTDRQHNYEFRCLEEGKKPYTYSDNDMEIACQYNQELARIY